MSVSLNSRWQVFFLSPSGETQFVLHTMENSLENLNSWDIKNKENHIIIRLCVVRIFSDKFLNVKIAYAKEPYARTTA